MQTEIRISGFGGQGVGLAGFIIGKALAIFSDFEAVMTQSYGPEARGGASSADIIKSDTRIDYPFVHNPDILLALSQEAYFKYRMSVKDKGLVLIDSGLVVPYEEDKVFGIPATELAEIIGNRIVSNMVMLGFFSAITSAIDREPLERAIETTVKNKFIELNLKAFKNGYVYPNTKNSSTK